MKGWSDLLGKEVLCGGKGATPDFLSRFLLGRNGLTPHVDVRLGFSFGHEQIAHLLVAGRATTAVLPEPHVTQVLSLSAETGVVLDLQREWARALGTDEPYPISVVVASPALWERSPQAVERFLEAYGASIRWVNEDPARAAVLVGKLDIMPEAVARSAIPRCNLDFGTGAIARRATEQYLGVLLEFDAVSVRSRLPDDGFHLTPWRDHRRVRAAPRRGVAPDGRREHGAARSRGLRPLPRDGSGPGPAAGRSRTVGLALDPVLLVIRSTPIMAVILLAMIWFRTGTVPVFVGCS